MQIPPDRLSEEVLLSLVEEFVTRQGALHGHQDVPLDLQIAQVLRQLRRGEARIWFDEDSESCTILPADNPRRP